MIRFSKEITSDEWMVVQAMRDYAKHPYDDQAHNLKNAIEAYMFMVDTSDFE